MKNKNGFTLVEIISVVVILGVLALIAVPAVSGYITNSRKTNYSTTILSYLQTVKGDYDMETYGDKIYDNELMIVPIKLVKLEKGGSTESPFGSYLYNKSYAIIAPDTYKDNYYAYFLDSNNYGLNGKKYDEISSSVIEQIDGMDILDLSTFVECHDNKFSLTNAVFVFKKDENSEEKKYTPCEYKSYGLKSSEYECSGSDDFPIIIMCEV